MSSEVTLRQSVEGNAMDLNSREKNWCCFDMRRKALDLYSKSRQWRGKASNGEAEEPISFDMFRKSLVF